MRPKLDRGGISGVMKRFCADDEEDPDDKAPVDGSDLFATVTVLRKSGCGAGLL